jgi:hypothetical protein
MRDAARAADVAARLHQWYLRRVWPPPLNRKRRLSGAPLFANTGNGNSIRNSGTGPALQLPARGGACAPTAAHATPVVAP